MTVPPNQAEAFLAALSLCYWPDEELRLEIRCLAVQQPAPAPRRWYPLDKLGMARAASDSLTWRDQYNVYMGVLPRIGQGGRADHVEYSRWLWADVDGGEDGAQAAFNLVAGADVPAPHLAVLSGGGAHCYWRLAEPVTFTGPSDRSLFQGLLRRLVRCIGGTAPGAHADGCRADCASILRVPGTYNHKGGRNRLTRLIHFSPDSPSQPLEWWQATLPALPSPPVVNLPLRQAEFTGVPRWAQRWSETPSLEGTRHHELLTMAARLKRDLSVPESAVAPLLQRKAQVSHGDRIITEREIEQIVRWA